MKYLAAFAWLVLFVPFCPAKDWTEYTGCRLTPGAYHDGDSFSGVDFTCPV